MIKAALFHPFLKKDRLDGVKNELRSHAGQLEEAKSLASALDLDIVCAEIVPLTNFAAKAAFTTGKLEELKEKITLHEATLAIIDCPITPIQQRNLEKEWNIKVIDRTGLILEIFGKRAATREGVLQVELAQLMYQKSRLVRAWSHLERQRGGGGFTGGPGETQKEADRRMIEDKIIRLKEKLANVTKTRQLHRSSRQKVPYPIVAIVGYTNAGKSTLFNRITKASVLEADMLFATLDPTMRHVSLPNNQKIILSDTVGFVSNLPTQLVAAFKATLEEVIEADIILHVRDMSNPETEQQKKDVEKILKKLEVLDTTPIIEVWNKTDLLPQDELNVLTEKRKLFDGKAILASAIKEINISGILEEIQEHLAGHKKEICFRLPVDRGDIVAALHRCGGLSQQHIEDDIMQIHARLTDKEYGQIIKIF